MRPWACVPLVITNKSSVSSDKMSLKYANTTSSTSWSLKCTDLAQFDALQAAAESFRGDDKLHLRNLCNDTSRCAGLTATHTIHNIPVDENSNMKASSSPFLSGLGGGASMRARSIILDYSRQRVTGETMELLFDLADAVALTDRREAMRWGAAINTTESAPVLHHILRLPENYSMDNRQGYYKQIYKQISAGQGGQDKADIDISQVIGDVHKMRARIRYFVDQVRSGEYRSVSDQPFRNVLAIGIGGYALGPEMVATALEADAEACRGAEGRTLRFLSNLDPVDFYTCTRDLDPAVTLVIVASKTFTEAECMINARAVRHWLVQNLSEYDEKQVVSRHMVAISSNAVRCVQFGIAKDRVFQLWDWVIGRLSLCSAVGLLPLSIHFSNNIMSDFLEGCHDMDEHYFHAPLRDNLPILLALLGVWNSTFLGHSCSAILPYSDSLRRFPAHIQLLDMESNGKRVALDGTPLLHRSAVVTFGEAGTNCQNTFFQLLHQGRVVPSDFIGFMESQQRLEVPSEAVSNHDELMTYFFSQPDALAYGKTLVDLVQEGAPEPLRDHMVFPGNRPSSSILMTKLDAFALGQLVTLYEHRTATQGFIWGINSFDQFGLELGRGLAKSVRAQLSAARRTGASVQGFNYSTSFLLEHYLANGKTGQGGGDYHTY